MTMAYRPKRWASAGFTLPQLLAAVALLAIGFAIAIPVAGRALDAFSLRRSADLARGHLIRARTTAVARREAVRVRLAVDRNLRLEDADGGVLSTTHIHGGALLRLDSVRLRPATLRFNARGQAAPGSIYLYRGKRGVRLVSNFLGRIRRETFRLP